MPNNLPPNYQPIIFNEQVFSCRLASNANLAANLFAPNPVNGLGTTLTNSGALAALIIDGVTPSIGDRILLLGQTATEQNGIYVVSNVGSINEAWILTRAPDWCCVEQMQTGQYVSIEDGVGLKGNIYVFVRPFPNRINFDPIAWIAVAFSSGGSVNPGLINQIAYYAAAGNVLSGTSTLPSLVQINPINANNGTGALGSTFWAGDDTWKPVSAATAHSIYAVYVAPDGNDTTGNGSINAPYKTISHALATITTNDASNVFNIILTGGVYTEAVQIALKPYVNLVGWSENTVINNAADIILHASWDTTTDAYIGIENLTINGNLDLDFNTVPNASGSVVNIFDVTCSDNLNAQGNATNPVIFWIYNTFVQEMFFNNAILESFGNYYFSIFTAGNEAFIAPAFLYSNGDYYNSGISLTGAAAGIILQEYNIQNSNTSIPLTVTGVNATLNIDATSYVSPTIIGGATVNLLTIANGVDAIYTPVNYTNDATGGTNPVNSVAAALHGIDNALGTVASRGLIWSEVTGTSQAAAVNHAYITNNGGLVTVTLPATAAIGDRVAINGKGAGGWSMVANTGQSIVVGNQTTSVAGSLSSTHRNDAIEIVCITANTTWAARSVIGSLTVA